MKTFLTCLLFFCAQLHVLYGQYGGYSNSGSTGYLENNSAQGIFSDTTYNDGSIKSATSATVYFIGSANNKQHQLLSKSVGATATQVGNVILQNGTGGLFINNSSTGLEVLTNFNFNAQRGQVTTLRDITSIGVNNLHIDANASISGSDASNNVNGYLKKDGDAANFTFPVAGGNVYAPITISAFGAGNSIVAAYYNSSPNSAAAFEGGPFTTSSIIPAGLNVSSTEYWNVNSSGSPTGNLSLTFQGDYSSTTLATFFIIGWRISTAQWEILPGSTASGLTPGNTISTTENINFSDYAAFTLGFDLPPVVTAISTPVSCGKLNGSITASGAEGVVPYQYSLNGVGFQSGNIFNSLDSGNYVVTIEDSFGLTSSINVNVASAPAGIIFAGNDTSVAIDQPFQLNAVDEDSTGYNQFTWSPSYGLNNPSIENPIATLNKDITYTVTGVAPNGCEAVAQISIKVFPGPEIYVPNAFTPNGDGKNDILKALPIGIQTFKYFAVYDRWGKQVFFTSNATVGWDGKINNISQGAATFVYMAEGIDTNGKTILKKGTVLLIR